MRDLLVALEQTQYTTNKILVRDVTSFINNRKKGRDERTKREILYRDEVLYLACELLQLIKSMHRASTCVTSQWEV